MHSTPSLNLMPPTSQAEVIDLTSSTPPSPIAILDSDCDDHPNPPTSSSQNSKKRKRKTKSAPPSRPASPSPDTNKHSSDEPYTWTHSAKRAKNDAKDKREQADRLDHNAKAARRSRSPSIPDDSLFFFDLKPDTAKPHATAPLEEPLLTSPNAVAAAAVNGDIQDTIQNTLLLPGHVSLLNADASSVEVLPPPSDATLQENFVEYLDYDDTRGVTRYFDQQKEEDAAPRRIVCKKCGQEGEHIAADCTVIICLTCGVRNEHPTRSCPITKVCFGCQMRGHVIQNCPHGGRGAGSQNRGNCTRCWDDDHGSAECPTLWRMYAYVLPEEKDTVLQVRESKMELEFGEGGEGYIATDVWCYNCGGSGHLGDDCEDEDFVHGHYGHSAFGTRNVMSGPFYDPEQESKKPQKSKRAPRAWEQDGYDHVSATLAKFGDKHVPDNVGKKGRTKERDKLAKMNEGREQEEQDNWFNARNVRNRSYRDHGRNDRPRNHSHAPRGSASNAGPSNSKMSFGKISFKGAADRDDCSRPSSSNQPNPSSRELPSGPRGASSSSTRSLLSRLGDDYHPDHKPRSRAERRQADRDREARDRAQDRERERDADKSSDWRHDRSRHDRDRDSRSYDDSRRGSSRGGSGGDHRRTSGQSQSGGSSRKSKESGPRYKGGYSR